MSFLKDFKDDLSQAVNELVDDNNVEETAVEENATEESAQDMNVGEEFVLDLDEIDSIMNEQESKTDEFIMEETVVEENNEDATEEISYEMPASNEEFVPYEEPVSNDEPTVYEEPATETSTFDENFFGDEDDLPSDEVAEITKGTSITGNIESDGSMNLYGKVKGDIKCKGKLIVTGRITGVSQAREIFANNAKIAGDVHSSGTIKVGNGSIIVGNVYATSAVIGGAIRGDIDVHGPVIIDGTAVVQGNIKSRSVQINNGAVIEGFCSQCYADIDYKSLFEDTFSEM